jgi:hypothetical protein
MQDMSRRSMLGSVAGLAVAAGLGACATNPTTGAITLDPTVIDAVQQGVATIASFLPTVESIVAEAASLFGPAYAGIVTIGSSALNALINAIASIVTNLAPPASAALHARLKGATARSPVPIGVTTSGVQILGYR